MQPRSRSRVPDVLARHPEHGALLAVSAALWTLHLVRLRNYVPMWDADWYAECVLGVVERPTLKTLSCAEHISHAFSGMLALTQVGHAPSYPAMLVALVVLALVAQTALYAALRRLDPGTEMRAVHALAASAVSFSPLVVGSAVHVNPDFTGSMWILVALYGFVSGRSWIVLLGGLFASFSKEPWAVVHVAMSALVLAQRFWTGTGTAVDRARAALRQGWVWFVPSALFGLAVLQRLLVLGPRGLNQRLPPQELARLVLSVDVTQPEVAAMARGFLVLNFLWIPMALLTVGVVHGLFAHVRRTRPIPRVSFASGTLVVYVALLTLFFIVTRFRISSTFRYITLHHALLPAAAVLATRHVWRSARVHAAWLTVFLALSVASQFRTFDPVSMVVFSTFEFGDRTLLAINRYTRDAAVGQGRDQLVYNTEFTGIHGLLNAVLREIRPTPRTVIAAEESTFYRILRYVDPVTFERRISSQGSIEPLSGPTEVFMDPQFPWNLNPVRPIERLPMFPDRMFHISLPNTEMGLDRRLLRQWYRQTSEKQVWHGGLVATLREFELRRELFPAAQPTLPRVPEGADRDAHAASNAPTASNTEPAPIP